MKGSKRHLGRFRCFSFRRGRNLFDYVDNPLEAGPEDEELTTEPSPRLSFIEQKEESEGEQPTQEKDTYSYDIYDPYVINLKPTKTLPGKSSRRRDRLRMKFKSADGATTDTTSSKPSEDHTTPDDYLGYGMIVLNDTKNKKRESHNNDSHEGRAFETRASVDPAESQNETNLSGRSSARLLSGSKLLIGGGKGVDSRSSLENRIWDMVEKRGWDMYEGRWNMIGKRVFDNLVQYLTGLEISLCRQVSKVWHRNINDVMVMRSEMVVDNFKSTYRNKLEYDRSYILFQPVLTATKSLRIDVIIRARVMSYCTLYKNSFGYTYSYISLPANNAGTKAEGANGSPPRGSSVPTFISKFIFEVLKKGQKRTITFTRDLSSMHGEDLNVATRASICQVCEGDFIEIPITLINAIGTTDVNSVKFLPIVKDSISSKATQIDQLHREWYTVEPNSKYLMQLFPQNIHSYSIIQPHKLLPQLIHQITQVAGIDVITSKSQYVANHTGVVEESKDIVGHTIEVVSKREPVISMIQRIGLQHDRICHVQLRPGDILQFYLTKG
ncbi:conserved hypothetical protein [Theileria equi strain WA]|uniref:Uncharacterized protein n=1 Tax=Theileria equi strain WA TaxID=1537102 RepID=L1LF64_THEEQ|nr:conserved hypothetical protein [Theileria equi strain WA]EKX74082.1 conserved hypothetical protein [Theileria equi strain WA]|eukprot:XP_004833534.1 conserved hypothetical protein [Theileria equi strain WA]